MDRLTVFKSYIHQRRSVFLGLSIFVVIVFSLVLFHKAAAPVNKLNAWKKLAQQEGFSVDNISSLDLIQKQIAYRKSLLTLTGKDSIHLVINLPDSSIGLFMNGMIIFKSQITSFEIDPLLTHLSPQLYGHQFSKAIKADTVRATIIKEPIIEKVAPKTQEEFLASVTLPDSVVFEPVYFELLLSNGIQLMFEQNGNDVGSTKEIKRQFYQPNRKAKFLDLLLAIVTFKTPEYQPQIRLEASNAELTSIYRALPIQPKVVISYH